MGIEYIAKFPIPLSPEISHQILLRCAAYSKWQTLDENAASMSFKLNDMSAKPHWDQDIEITINENSLYVVFHSVSRSQRDHCIVHLNQCIRTFDLSSELEEI
jgi:hypothetical protein